MISSQETAPNGKPVKISVVMIDGGFREGIFGADSFSRQDFPADEYEVIWVEYFGRPHPGLARYPKVDVQPLGRDGVYHSSYCFNHGIRRARGELIVIPDADQIVRPDFLARVWELHQAYDKLAIYGYRYDEVEQGLLASHDFDELERRCVLKNPTNYGGCLTARKKWLLEVNGYEQHPIFRTGNHANGLDMFTRFKNLGLAIQWEPSLRLYHPWHPFTLQRTLEHEAQEKLVQWRRQNVQWLALEGIDPGRNADPPERVARMLQRTLRELETSPSDGRGRGDGKGAARATNGTASAARPSFLRRSLRRLLRVRDPG
ncbi:MAG: glycosyltransferase family 2 protein [Planctomycetota bacterium]